MFTVSLALSLALAPLPAIESKPVAPKVVHEATTERASTYREKAKAVRASYIGDRPDVGFLSEEWWAEQLEAEDEAVRSGETSVTP